MISRLRQLQHTQIGHHDGWRIIFEVGMAKAQSDVLLVLPAMIRGRNVGICMWAFGVTLAKLVWHRPHPGGVEV